MCLMWSKGGSPARTRREDNASEDALLPGKGLSAWVCGGTRKASPPGERGPREGRKRVVMLVSR